MSAPTTPFKVIGWWNSQYEGSIMIIGVIAMSVLAMPAPVYCTAISEKPTPMKGPKIVVVVAVVMLILS